jgi:hypothetical protein
MTDVVGLRFTVEGEREAFAAIKTYETLKKNLSNSIQQGVSVINRLEGEMKRLVTAYQKGTITERTYRDGVVQITRAYKNLNEGVHGTSMSMQKASSHVHTMRRSLEQQKAAAEELRATQQRMATALALSMQRHREETAAAQAATQARQRAQQGYDQLRAAIDPAVAAQQRYADAERRVAAAVQQGIVTKQQGTATLAQYRTASMNAAAGAYSLDTAAGRVRQQMLATANSIAILDGPLGGVASRFSALGVLIGRTGLLLAGAAVSFATFFMVASRGIRAMNAFEVEMAKIHATLHVTRHAAGLTARDIEAMADRIGAATLESEAAIRQAAARLLTFRDIAGDVFEQVLRSAADMAALGFGTVESEAIKLAKALEDPAQALTSLSRAGIVFTRQQRALIISMVEAGDRAGAMERILANVNARVGGAAEAAARDTMAGSLDTLGQSARRFARDLGGMVLSATGADATIRGLAAALAEYAAEGGAGDSALRDQEAALAAQEETLAALTDGLERLNLARESVDQSVVGLGTADYDALIRQQEDLIAVVVDSLAGTRAQTEALREQRAEQERLIAVQQISGQVERSREGLDNLRAEIEMRQQLVGLTEEQQRAMRAFAAEGLLMSQEQVNAAVGRYRTALQGADVDVRILNRLVNAHREELESLPRLMQRYIQSLGDARTAMDGLRAADGLQEQLSAQARILSLVEQGVDLGRAQQEVQDDALRTQLRAALAVEGLGESERIRLETALATVDAVRLLEDRTNAVIDAQQVLEDMTQRLDNIHEENAILEMQLQLLADGVSYNQAIALAEIEVQRQRVQTLMITEGVTAELEAQLALLNAMADATVQNVELRERVTAQRPSRSGGGGGAAPRVEELITLESIVDKLHEEERIRRELLGLGRQERVVRETYYRLVEQLGDQAANYNEQQIMAAAERIEAWRAENDAIEAAIEKAEQLQEAIVGGLTDAFGNFFESGFRDFEGFVDDILSTFRTMLTDMVAEAARQQIEFFLGVGPQPQGGLFNLFGGGAVGGTTAGGGSAGAMGGITTGATAAAGVSSLGGAIGALAGPVGIAIGLFSIFGANKQRQNDKNKRIEDERYDLETRRLELMGDTNALLERQIERLHSSNQELGREVQALELKQAVEDEALALSIRLATAQGDINFLRQEEMKTIDQANAALLESVWAAEEAARVAQERATLEVQLAQAQGDVAAVRRMELDALDETNRELQKQINFQNDLNEIMSVAERQQDELLRLQGDTQALRERELEAMSPWNRARQEQIYLLEDQIALANELAPLEEELLRLQGDTEALRARQLEGMSAQAQALQEQIWLLQDAEAAVEASTRALDERYRLETRLLTLQEDTTELRRRELELLDPTNRALQEQIWLTEDALNRSRERYDLETRLLTLEGDRRTLRRRELDLLEPENRELQRQIWRMEKAIAISREQYDLETRLLTLQEDTTELRRRELELMYPANRALQEQIWLTEDALNRSRERYGLETRLLTLQGNTAELRRRELELLDPTNRALQQQIWALEDLQRALSDIDMNDFVSLVDYNRAVARASFGMDYQPASMSTLPTMTGASPTPQTVEPFGGLDSDTKAAIEHLTNITQQLLTRIDNNTRGIRNRTEEWDAEGLPVRILAP